MRIDAYTHFFPPKFFNRMLEKAGDHKDMGKRVRAVPLLHALRPDLPSFATFAVTFVLLGGAWVSRQKSGGGP